MYRWIAPILGALALLAACSNPAADCASDEECDDGQICVTGGGLLFAGGRCVQRGHLVDGGPADGGGGDTVDTSNADAPDAPTDADGETVGDADTTVGADVCTPSKRRPCYNGPPGTAGVGICEEGSQGCGDGGWQSCRGQTLPNSYDRCNNGKDDDCDGRVDERARAGEPCIASCNCLSERCIDGKCAHRLFVTSEGVTGNLGGVSGADTFCQRMADAGPLEGNWRAIISSTTLEAKSRLRIAAPIIGLDGHRIADGAADLWDGSLDAPPNVDEKGKSREYPVWTGTGADGSAEGRDCKNWGSGSMTKRGMFGESSQTTQKWIRDDLRECASEAALYCIDGQ